MAFSEVAAFLGEKAKSIETETSHDVCFSVFGLNPTDPTSASESARGIVYVAFVIDAYARRIVGRRVSRTAHAGFVLDALEQALHAWRPVRRGGLIHHSD